MSFSLILNFVAGFLCFAGASSSDSSSHSPRAGSVLLIAFDGFGWDFMSKANTPNLDLIVRTGVKAPFIRNVFPTVTLPNMQSLVTGLYPESHGLVGNKMYDPNINATFNANNSDSRWWDGGEPAWITNEKHGFKSGVSFWPGFDVTFQGYFPTYSTNGTEYAKPFAGGKHVMPWTDRVELVMKWLTGKEPATFIAMYFEEPDETGSNFGPNSTETKRAIERDDQIIGYLIKRLKEEKLFDGINLIVTGDHGQIGYNTSYVLNFDEILDLDSWDSWSGSTCYFNINPRPGKESYVYEQLWKAEKKTKLFKFYKKSELPENFHYKNNPRIGPIIGYVKEGWVLNTSKYDVVKYHTPPNTIRGNHGYSNLLKDMFPFFIARGPAFKQDYKSEPFNSVDLYPLMCHILGIQSAPNNGSFEQVESLLRHSSSHVQISFWRHTAGLVVFSILSILVAGVVVIVLAKFCWRRYKCMGNRVIVNELESTYSRL